MRESCRIAKSTLDMIKGHIVPGVTTSQINELVHSWTLGKNAWPSPLNYGSPPFPKSVCTSVNEVACHGVPGPRVLLEGDIINVDVTCYYPLPEGFHGDTSRTFMVGEVSAEDNKLLSVAEEALCQGIAQVRPGAALWDIGTAIEAYTRSEGHVVVKEAYGHGIGTKFHAPPRVPHYAPSPQEAIGDMRNCSLVEGMIFTIEPIIARSPLQLVLDPRDGWSVLSACGGKTAQFEHTVRVTDDSVEILTA